MLVISCKYPFISDHNCENNRLTVLSSLSDEQRSNHNGQLSRQAITIRDLSDKIVYAFQLATGQGPLCQEPVQGIAVVLEDIALHVENENAIDFGRLTGEAIRIVRDSVSQGFLDWSPRILLAMYSCEIQASSKPTHNHQSTDNIRKLTEIKISRSSRPSIRRHNPTKRPHPLRNHERRNPLLHHSFSNACSRIIRLFR